MRTPRRRAALVGGVTAALVLTGCGGGDGDDSGSDEGPEPSSTATMDLPEDGTSRAYLEAPDDVELTEPGTELALGDAATVAWQPRQDLVGVVEVTVTALERADLARDFAGYRFEGVAATSTPYFVRADVENVGDTDLGGRRLPIYGVDDSDRLIEPSTVDRTFTPCPASTLPAVFAPDDTASTCLVLLVASGSELGAAMFRPPEGVAPLTWTGAIEAYQPPKPPKKPKKPKNRRNQSGQSGQSGGGSGSGTGS